MMYRSKVDVGLAVGVGFGVVVAWVGAFLVLRQGNPWGWVALAVVVAVVAVIFPVTYRIDARTLVVRSGVIRWHIPLDAIEAVHPTRNPFSSPAWSLDRLHVSYRGGDGGIRFILISPSRRREFLAEIAEVVPELALKDGALERTGARHTFTG